MFETEVPQAMETNKLEFQLAMVERVKTCPNIWDYNRGDYTDQKKRDMCFKKIADELGMTIDDCKKQWKYIRDHYGREKKKLLRNTNDDGRPLVIWELYNNLSFLDPFVNPKMYTDLTDPPSKQKYYEAPSLDTFLQNPTNTVHSAQQHSTAIEKSKDNVRGFLLGPNNNSCSSSTPNSEDMENLQTYSAIFQQPLAKRPRLGGDTENGLDSTTADLISAISQRQIDEDCLFGLSIAASLKSMQARERAVAKLKIFQAMYEVQFGASAAAVTSNLSTH